MIPTISEYFPEINGNLNKVVWAHAVNNQSALNAALKDSKIMMLEADVILGSRTGQTGLLPVMGHPPITVSDLTLLEFLETVIKFQSEHKKGVKLDFKTTESFNASWSAIDLIKSKITFPFFLNADILSGPIDSTVKPVDPDIFLSLSTKKFPSSTLSVGWTTRYGPGMEGNYSHKQLNEMLLQLKKNKIKQPVTLCVRAGIAANTFGIKTLMDNIDDYQQANFTTLTIWMSSNSDPVNLTNLRDFIHYIEPSRTFLDLPKFLLDRLSLDYNSSISINTTQKALHTFFVCIYNNVLNFFFSGLS